MLFFTWPRRHCLALLYRGPRHSSMPGSTALSSTHGPLPRPPVKSSRRGSNQSINQSCIFRVVQVINSGVGTMVTGGTLFPQLQDLYSLYPPSQRCGLCQNFKQTTLTTRPYKVCTNLYPAPTYENVPTRLVIKSLQDPLEAGE